jgi:ribosomal protein S21
MAAISLTSSFAAVKSVKSFIGSPLSPSKVKAHGVVLPRSSVTSSAHLLASELSRRERDDCLKMDSAFASLKLSLEKSVGYGAKESLGVDQIIGAPWDPWDIMQVGREDSVKQNGSNSSAPTAWRDPSQRYANVMWFKGSYNVEIICGEEEPEESIVRRFRQAVSSAGVIRECQRRRYKETPQDIIKRKQRQAAFNRKRKPT